MTIKPWKTLESKYLLQDKWMTLRADKCETPNGTIVEPYYVQEPCNWAHIVAFDKFNRILLTRQYRHGIGKVCVELPCGAIEDGEEPIVAMKRELLEETGCTAERIEPLPIISPNPARYNNLIYSFVAYGTNVVDKQSLDESEEIDFSFEPIEKVMELVHAGEFLQALHIATLFVAFEKAGMLAVNSV